MFKPITSFDELVKESEGQPVLVYKHSATCGKSTRAQKQVESYLINYSKDAYRLVVHDERPLSNEIAEVLQIKHETPQLIALSKGKPLFVLNHDNVTLSNLEELLR